MTYKNKLEQMACELDANEDYRVLRKLKQRNTFHKLKEKDTRLGLFVDVETTGLDYTENEIIELAIVPFNYGLNGEIFNIKEPFQSFQQPKNGIPKKITELAGISDKMVEGQMINNEIVSTLLSDAQLIVAHNAEFDRRFLEAFNPKFVDKPWACTMSQIDWSLEGVESRKLIHLLAEFGFFYDHHRAVDECFAGIELLNRSLPKSGERAMKQLLEIARCSTWRIWAENSPFEFKDILKKRGYRWNADGTQKPRAWYIDVKDNLKEAELDFLKNQIYKRDINLLVEEVTAYNRFSDRT